MRTFLGILLIVLTNHCVAQVIKTKDGVSLGPRNEFISSCSEGNEIINIDGIEVKLNAFCACMCDDLITNINSWELERALAENKLSYLLANDANLEILLKCLEGNFQIDENFNFDYSTVSELQKKGYIKNCNNTVISLPENKNIWTKNQAKQYCECTLNKMIDANYTYKEILSIENENSSAFNEIALPCLNTTLRNSKESKFTNTKSITKIEGGGSQSFIQLVDNLGKGYKVKITIEDISKYYVFDTGASDIIIDRDTERELLLNGVLKRENYLGKTEYTLANNQTVQAQKVRVNNISIGEYTLNNVEIGIINDGVLLCGKSFLDKFSKWEIDNQNKYLILYK